MVACLKQIDRPLDRRNMAVLVDAYNAFAPSALDPAALVSRSETDGVNFLETWTAAVGEAGLPQPVTELVDIIAGLAAGRIRLRDGTDQILERFEREAPDASGEPSANRRPIDDLKDDLSAWRRISREVRAAQGATSLDRFLQEVQLRSKEPAPTPGTVPLTTIHGAKGLEFDTVYLIGLAEEVLPSWQSVQRGDGSAALEEERRGCFVAVTRARRRLVLSRARTYRGWRKAPSRFLAEMGCLGGALADNRARGAG